MDHNSDFSMKDAMRLAQSPVGQQLFAMMQQQNSPEFQSAMQSAASGDYQKAKEMLTPLLQSPEIQALLNQLGR